MALCAHTPQHPIPSCRANGVVWWPDSGWFLKFDPAQRGNYSVPPCAAENKSKCSVYYHDQEQTPAVPTAASPHPDGSCTDDVCDCGTQPCGEYLYALPSGAKPAPGLPCKRCWGQV